MDFRDRVVTNVHRQGAVRKQKESHLHGRLPADDFLFVFSGFAICVV
jgi:hypothetical protein